MGGRGSRFKDVNSTIPKPDNKSYLDFGNADLDNEIHDHNNLTKNLKDSNILVCQSLENMNEDIIKTNLNQINTLSKKFDNLISKNLEDEGIKIRSYKMNRVSYTTGKSTAEYGVMALFAPGKKQICFNERTFKSDEQIINLTKESQKSGYSVETDKGKENLHIITHEYGHFIEQCIIEKHLQNDIHQWAKYRASSPIEKEEIRRVEARKIKQQIKDIATQKYKAKPKQLITSEYGEKDKYSFEWFAEVFAESQLHTTEKPIVKAMKDYLKEEIKDVQI